MNTFFQKIIVKVLIVAVCLFIFSQKAFSEVRIKFIVMNPSEKEERTIPVKYYLPKEVKYEDVLNAGELEVDYDITQKKHFVKGTAILGPKETHVFSISVKDVWKVSDEKLKLLTEFVNNKSQELKGSANESTVNKIKDNILRRIGDVQKTQQQSQSITSRVEAYRTNIKQIESIENDILVMESIASGEGDIEPETITLVLEATNSQNVEGTFPIKHYLPPELDIDDVIDSAGLEVNYDVDRERLKISGVADLSPGEKREYKIKVKDVWKVDEKALKGIESEKNKLLEQLFDTEFESLSVYLGSEIDKLIATIREVQKEELSFKMRISSFTENNEKFLQAKAYLERIRSFILQFEMARAGTEGDPQLAASESATKVSMGAGKGKAKGGGMGGKKGGKQSIQRGGGLKGIRGLKGLILVSKSMFKGWKPEVATTWIIILGIVGFLFIFALFFYLISFMMSAGKKKEEVVDINKETEQKEE